MSVKCRAEVTGKNKRLVVILATNKYYVPIHTNKIRQNCSTPATAQFKRGNTKTEGQKEKERLTGRLAISNSWKITAFFHLFVPWKKLPIPQRKWILHIMNILTCTS